MKFFRTILLILAGVVAALLIGLQALLNSSVPENLIRQVCDEKLDADLNFSSVRISLFRNFPILRVSVDSLSLTYPHNRFAAWDSYGVHSPVLRLGRGEDVDTLASFSHFTAAVNPWKLRGGVVRLRDAGLSSLRVFARLYGDGEANWNILKPSVDSAVPMPVDSTLAAVSDSVSAARKILELLKLDLGTIKMDDAPILSYASLPDTLFALLQLDSMELSGYGLNRVEMNFDARAVAVNPSVGKIEAPLSIDGAVEFDCNKESMVLRVPRMCANLAYVPLDIDGVVENFADSAHVDARLMVDDCSLDTMFRRYVSKLVSEVDDLSTDARLDLDIKVNGPLTRELLPEVSVALGVDRCNVYYKPLSLPLNAAVSVSAKMHRDRSVSADIRNLYASIPGAEMSLKGTVGDALGYDPRFRFSANASAVSDSLMRFVPQEAGIGVSGALDMMLDADTRLSEIRSMRFRKSRISGKISGNRLNVAMPSDSLMVDASGAEVNLSADEGGLEADFDLDSARMAMGTGLMARVRGMKNHGRLFRKMVADGNYAPAMEIDNRDRMLFVKAGSNRIILSSLGAGVSLQKRYDPRIEKMRRYMDSLRRVYPDKSVEEIRVDLRRKIESRELPDYLRDKAFRAADIKVELDSSVRNFLKDWQPGAKLYAKSGMFAIPALPLRTRLDTLKADFDGNIFKLDTVAVRCGSSDIALSGTVGGLSGLMQGFGILRADLVANSHRFNLNEILNAAQIGYDRAQEGVTEEVSNPVSIAQEADESFVVDGLEDAKLDSLTMPPLVIPANVIADVKVKADRFDISEVRAEPVTAELTVQERTARLLNTSLATNLGDIDLEAFYSTRTREDMAMGLDASLRKMSAENIIRIIPTVDTLMPVLRSFKGDLDCDISVTTKFDGDMNILMPTLDGVVSISGQNLRIDDAGPLRKVTRLLRFRNKNIGNIDDMTVSCVVHDNKLEIFPFILGVDRYTLALRGMQGFDKTMNYHVSIIKSPFLLKFGINLYGTLDDWRFSLGKSLYKNGIPVFTEQLDQMRFNIVDYIHNIYNTSAVNPNAGSMAAIDNRFKELGEPRNLVAENLSDEEAADVENMLVDSQFDELDATIEAEADASLSMESADTSTLMREYEMLMNDPRIMRKIERLKKKSERKAARKANRN